MPSKLTIEIGSVFGRYTVLEEAPSTTKPSGAKVRQMFCRCQCGVEKVVRLSSLTSGATVSCGCFHKENASGVLKTASVTHGKSKSKLYQVWVAMIQRCENPNRKDFGRYGGRGIVVCDRWATSFENFEADMGAPGKGMTLERIDVNGNYEPANCRWASYKEQARNTRRNHLYTINGVTRCLAEWCEVLGEPWTTVKKRLASGKDPFVRQRKRRLK